MQGCQRARVAIGASCVMSSMVRWANDVLGYW